MSRESALLASLTDEPVSTSDLYDRLGYPALVALGLVSYHAFRAELGKLAEAGLVACEIAPDGATVWWLVPGDGGDSPAPVDAEQ
jgi:hypothetical protein